ncbi:hypothetical protein [Nocardiopsis composta]|uniref:Uncharacterized protein n=1 Tax=Nocardiopsis composta TaxID=157465 RepID=A0A7W8QSA0_9ACTN|nr:hypothetical protein [Nocardiopsis composta]MBB5435194.1 hypothetical protein [Nocardiopsis composta]
MWYLRCRAQRAGLRARRAICERPAPVDVAEEPDAGEDPAEAAGTPDSPEALLRAAVRTGVLTGGEAELIAATRLEETTLRAFAERRGAAYWALAKQRSRAEERLVAALRAGDLSTEPPVSGPRGSGLAEFLGARVSKTAWALAL